MQTIVAGASASTVSTLILYPWEKIKIQMQVTKTHHHQKHSQQSSKTIQCQTHKHQHTQTSASLIQTIQKIKRQQGIAGFYKGLKPLVLGNALSYAIYFYFYELFKKVFPGQLIMSSMKASGSAGVVCSLFVNPFWVLQTQLALARTNNEKVITVVKRLIHKQGWQALWKGLSSSIILVSNPIIQFCIYELLKSKADPKGKYYHAIIFLIAAFSKAIATIFTYPYTVIRTYQHLDKSHSSIIKIVLKILEDSGPTGLFKGLTPKMIQTVLNSAILMIIYERLLLVFKFLLKLMKGKQ